MNELLEISLRSFWSFCGSFAILCVFSWIFYITMHYTMHYMVNGFVRCWARFLRIINLMKNGYPPEHCDADGDFKKEEDEA